MKEMELLDTKRQAWFSLLQMNFLIWLWRLLLIPSMKQRLKENARKEIETCFSVDVEKKLYLQLLKGMEFL